MNIPATSWQSYGTIFTIMQANIEEARAAEERHGDNIATTRTDIKIRATNTVFPSCRKVGNVCQFASSILHQPVFIVIRIVTSRL